VGEVQVIYEWTVQEVEAGNRSLGEFISFWDCFRLKFPIHFRALSSFKFSMKSSGGE
jgi:hypothetical protein